MCFKKSNNLRLGNLKIKNRIFLAPMHQVNDIAFRLLCKKAGASLTYTGLLNPQTREKLYLQDKPAIQFACNSTKGIKEFIKRYDKHVSLYDFNLGCPSPHAKQSRIGYFMFKDIKKIEDIIKTIKENTKKPLTIKIRKIPIENAKEIIALAEEYCCAIGVHPRTQEQGYSGDPDFEFAKYIKKVTNLPIIYSGNINNLENAKKLLKEFDYIMIGRASIGNPGIFSEILKKRVKITFFDWLKLAKKIEGRKLNLSQIKFQAINFTKGFEGSGKTRLKLSLAKNEREIIQIMKERQENF